MNLVLTRELLREANVHDGRLRVHGQQAHEVMLMKRAGLVQASLSDEAHPSEAVITAITEAGARLLNILPPK